MINEVPRPNLESYDTFTQNYAEKNVKPLVIVDPPVDTFNFTLRIKDNRSHASGVIQCQARHHLKIRGYVAEDLRSDCEGTCFMK